MKKSILGLTGIAGIICMFSIGCGGDGFGVDVKLSSTGENCRVPFNSCLEKADDIWDRFGDIDNHGANTALCSAEFDDCTNVDGTFDDPGLVTP